MQGLTEDSDVGPTILGRLEALGAVEPGSLRAKAGIARWRALVTFHWDQVFAPGVTAVEHRYRPIPGFQFLPFAAAEGSAGDGRRAAIADYCITPAETVHLDHAFGAQSGWDADYFHAATLGYVLSTGANWAGPIRHFHLEIVGDNESHDGPIYDTIELCADFPVRRPARGRVEADVENFTPTRDIHALLLFTNATQH